MEAFSLKCPNCGGEIVFDPVSQKFHCEYCHSEFTRKELSMEDGDEARESERDQEGTFASGEKTADFTEKVFSGEGEENAEDAASSMMEYRCPSCGAQIVTDETTAATFCYYCHSPVVLEGRLSGEFLPDRIIPFQIDKKTAAGKFLSYVKRKRFVPRAFFEESQLEKLSGIYYPYWMCDCEVGGKLSGEGTRVRIWMTGETEYTETSVYHVTREGTARIGQITRNALRKSDRELVEGVMPFRMEEAKPFSIGYLSGFFAEKRDLERKDLGQEIRQEAAEYAQRAFRNTVEGYNVVNVQPERMELKEEHWQYLLLPVWVLTYRGRNGHLYYYTMNGQTGAVCGELPVDYTKLGLFSLLTGLFVLVLFLIGGYLL